MFYLRSCEFRHIALFSKNRCQSIRRWNSWISGRGNLNRQSFTPGNVTGNLIDLAGTGGNLTADAHIAALAMENSAKLSSAGYDFSRFPGLLHFNPLE